MKTALTLTNPTPKSWLACLEAQSSAPKTVKPLIQEPQGERLVALLHTSPRVYNRKTSVWTLSLLAEVAAETKITLGG